MTRNKDVWIRKRRYDAKTDGNLAKIEMDNSRESMIVAYKRTTIRQERFESLTKGIIKNRAKFHDIPAYMCFAQEIMRIMDTHTGNIVCDEINIMRVKWETRGLDHDILNDIIKTFANKCVIIPPVITPFLLDHSLLDGTDVLM